MKLGASPNKVYLEPLKKNLNYLRWKNVTYHTRQLDLGEKSLVLKTLQIATVGENTDVVLTGVRNFPAHKLALICLPKHKDTVNRFTLELERILKIPIDVYVVPDRGNPLDGMLDIVANILKKDGRDFEDIIINVAGGDKVLTCAAVSAAFINGLKAFHVMGDMPVMLPILKLSYNEIVSKAKIAILQAIDKAEGEVKSLKQLSTISGYGKPLLSHHIQGAENSRGLVKLGLVEIERGKRGRTRVKLTTLGKMLLSGATGSAEGMRKTENSH